MNKIHTALILSIALLIVTAPVPVLAESAEDWLSKGRLETNPAVQIDYFTKAIRLNPELAEAYTCRGTANNDLGRYDRAIADYTSAIRLNPDNAQYYNNRGYSYEMLAQHEKAVADYTRAIRIEPHYASAFNNRGVAYYNMGQMDKALADFDKACKYGYGKGCENYYMIK